MTVTVVVRSFDDDSYRHVVGTGLDERKAERVVSGLLINLDSERYYVDEEDE